MKNIALVLGGIALALFLVFGGMVRTTGFLQSDEIDVKDLAHWSYDDGVIAGAQGFTLLGTSGTCWVMVHGYTSTPDELREVATAVNGMFNDTVYVPRLDGHGTVPSDVEHYTVDFWYSQIEDLAARHNCTYLLGSSMGASLVLRYAEEHPVDGVALLGTPFNLQPSYLPTGELAKILAPVVRYTKRDQPGQTVDDPIGREEHITGYSFPLKGVAELYEFDKPVVLYLSRVNASVLFMHAQNDTVADISGARMGYELIRSPKRFVVLNGDHIIMRDYDKEKAITEVLLLRKNATGNYS